MGVRGSMNFRRGALHFQEEHTFEQAAERRSEYPSPPTPLPGVPGRGEPDFFGGLSRTLPATSFLPLTHFSPLP
ncbi:MAG: hypothetical protein JWN70_3149 [Planctomycetaceae bacterium]|nr:hypothetical protein [Planctomycetaceae bacterium]